MTALVPGRIRRLASLAEALLTPHGMDRYLELSGESIEQVRGSRREGAVQRVKLELVDDHRFGNGTMHLHYRSGS